MDIQSDSSKIDRFLQNLLRESGLRLTYAVTEKSNKSGTAIFVEFEGPDSQMLVARNAELLLALEHIAAKMLRLTPEKQEHLSFEAGGFKAHRNKLLQEAALIAVGQVSASGDPYEFPPMNSGERRILHRALEPWDVESASEGEDQNRRLIVRPQARRA